MTERPTESVGLCHKCAAFAENAKLRAELQEYKSRWERWLERRLYEDNERLRAALEREVVAHNRTRHIFRVNMLRYAPEGVTGAEIENLLASDHEQEVTPK